MGEAPDRMTHEIRDTRQDLTADVDALADKVNPARIVQRRTEATRSRFASVRDSVMGSATSARERAAGTGSGVTDSVSSGVGSAVAAVDTVEAHTVGSPLVAGGLAFGAGWLLSALVPASTAEQRAAQRTVDTAREQAQPVVEEVRAAGQEVGQNLKESAADAAAEVKDTAAESAQRVKDEGVSSAETVREDATTR